ncbi:hypothetical protein [Chengkuizengella axinellae]|uniref:Uncharacterized protein n=1 Tax=Chengkuizengella axinellae TaxID=3064388 RepID=A0ABT9J4Y8_9BACL|nr:hypothetical protein [Chengkuizengella sp. 2205SS18-9]MDP5276665.1 hypothetical protein [Chengkuizengella sp. 2205SS18-9]
MSTSIQISLFLMYLVTIAIDIKYIKSMKLAEKVIFYSMNSIILILIGLRFIFTEFPMPIDFFIHYVSPWVLEWSRS